MEILGSQFGIILFMVIGFIVLLAINKGRKEKMSADDAEDIMGCFMWVGIIVAVFVYLCYACSNSS